MNLLPFKPYADELLYSYLARGYRYLGRPGIGEFNRRFLGRFSVSYTLSAMPGLTYLKEHSRADPLSLLPLDYYLPFLSAETKEKVVPDLLVPGSRPYNRLGLNTSPSRKKTLVYCPVCVSEDVKKEGEAWLHLDHYMAGIDVCPRHGLRLLEYTPPENRDIVVCPEFLDADRTDDIRIPASAAEVRLADFALQMLSGKFRNFSAEDVSRILYSHFSSLGLVKGGYVRAGKIHERVRNFFGEGFAAEYSLNIEKGRNYISKSVRGNGRIYPFQTLAIISTFFESMEDFFSTPAETEAGKTKRRNPGHYHADRSRDYSMIDLELENKLRAARESLLNYYPCKRVLASSLLRECGYPRQPEKLDRMERSSAYLEEAKESLIDYYIRFTKEAVKRLAGKNIPPTRINLYREMGEPYWLYDTGTWEKIRESLAGASSADAPFFVSTLRWRLCGAFPGFLRLIPMPVLRIEITKEKIKEETRGNTMLTVKGSSSMADFELEYELRAARESLLNYYPCNRVLASSLFRKSGFTVGISPSPRSNMLFLRSKPVFAPVLPVPAFASAAVKQYDKNRKSPVYGSESRIRGIMFRLHQSREVRRTGCSSASLL